MEEERRGPGVQPPVWLRRPGRRRHGENGQRVEDGAGALPLRCRIHPGEPVSAVFLKCANVNESLIQRSLVYRRGLHSKKNQ